MLITQWGKKSWRKARAARRSDLEEGRILAAEQNPLKFDGTRSDGTNATLNALAYNASLNATANYTAFCPATPPVIPSGSSVTISTDFMLAYTMYTAGGQNGLQGKSFPQLTLNLADFATFTTQQYGGAGATPPPTYGAFIASGGNTTKICVAGTALG